MSKQANPTLIGAFVIGGIVLLVAAVMVFGGSELFSKKTRVVTYFPGSVKGLRVGSNVTLRGVRIGYVNRIQLLGDVNTLETTVEVSMEILPNSFRLTRKGELLTQDEEPEIPINDVIDAGLRARLGYESLVTGQLQVELDFYPDTPPIFRSESAPHSEIPSIPSAIQQVIVGLREFLEEFRDKIDVDKLLADVQGTISGANALANSPDLQESLAGVNRIVNDEDMQELSASLQLAIADLRGTLGDTRSLVNNLDAQVGPIADELLPALARLDSLLAAGEQTLKNAAAQIRGDTELAYELTSTLNEVQGAARSLKTFLDYLERNPEALIRGKQPGE